MIRAIWKMDLGVGEKRFIFCDKHSLMTRTWVNDPGFKGSLVFFFACYF